MKIKAEQLKINDIIYYVNDTYIYVPQVSEIVINKIELKEKNLIINNYTWFYGRGDYFENTQCFFSKNKANRVLESNKMIIEKRKEKYKKMEEKKKQFEEYIEKEKLNEKYLNKPIMINRCHEWTKTYVKKIYATDKGIYMFPKIDGHICKLSKEGKTWKWWSELEELETKKKELEDKIKKLKEGKYE